MPKSNVPIGRSIFDGNTLSKKIANIHPQLDKIKKCELLTTRLNDVYILQTATDKYVIKLYGKNKNEREILAEIELIDYLHEKQFPIVKAIADPDQRYVHPIQAPEGLRHLVMFEYIHGKQITFDNVNSSQYGQLIAQLHLETNDWKPNYSGVLWDIEALIDKPAYYVKKNLPTRIKSKFLNETTKICRDVIQSLPKTEPYYGICHGDIVGNAIVKSNAHIVLFDLDWFGHGWRIYDVSQFLWAVDYKTLPTLETSTFCSSLLWQEFFNAYKGSRALSAEEERAIPAFLIARCLWLIGKQLEHSNTIGKADALYNLEAVWDTLCEHRKNL